ncbi:hypothetical protein E7T09_02320 [Deinococcus sp. KSM4-11]|uniref:hypothetical protein n=1 Tax=Deinococcus sp. KSM4-11 TaxID=2568654 RepID=UPI0010A38967|nr:hypothetical protein [Deinococcus sp. KSM4-11]THF88074.1 hypothetical protein E7T09_02320 [Deinococcus sp. KSM4-11]
MQRNRPLTPWESRGTPASALPHRRPGQPAPQRSGYTPQTLTSALIAEEQRQVFAILNRLRQARLR